MLLSRNQKARSTTKRKFDIILNKFLVFLKKEIKFNYDIPIILVNDAFFSKKYKTFGIMLPDKIIVSLCNRHPIDVLRTVAHEYIHHKQQYQGKKLNGNPGSITENEANAKAGEVVRKYVKFHPDLFELSSIH